MIDFRCVQGKTSRAMRTLLGEKGVVFAPNNRRDAIVSWGRTIEAGDVPCLNANAGRLNKYEELLQLVKRGISTIPVGKPGGNHFMQGCTMFLGRRFKHTKGKDIVVYNRYPVHTDSDFVTGYIPQKAEYRVWTFRGTCLGVYQKELTYPWKAKKRPGIAWNWRRGYAFKFFKEAPEELKQLGIGAVRALDLDFGAVDVLQAKDGGYYVLEVNTAPGTRGEARQGLTYLATKIARWGQNGFKKRNEWK